MFGNLIIVTSHIIIMFEIGSHVCVCVCVCVCVFVCGVFSLECVYAMVHIDALWCVCVCVCVSTEEDTQEKDMFVEAKTYVSVKIEFSKPLVEVKVCVRCTHTHALFHTSHSKHSHTHTLTHTHTHTFLGL